MRDDQIFQIQRDLNKKISHMYKQVQFLDLRIQAYENVLLSKWNTFRAILSPKWLKVAVDKEHLRLSQKHDDELKAAIEKRQEEVSKPKLTLPPGVKKIALALLVFSFIPSCISKKAYQEGIDMAYAEGYEGGRFECEEEKRKFLKRLIESNLKSVPVENQRINWLKRN